MNTLALSQPSRTSLISRLAATRAILGRLPQSVFSLLFRVSIGAVFFKSGLVKVQSWESTLGLFRDEYALPLLPPSLAAYLGTAAELICPVLIVLGLFARLGAAALFAMTMVIQFLVYPENWAEHLMWASLLGFIISRGPGTLSLDAPIARHLFGRA
ncbi:MAG: DoxX family protein [Alphaproteobacteria bacterium]|nr:DoxX family protein [Alphaproteobacteria bacterium]MCW5741825.1 DoxX family protein [Alphaproteobacteria bacterium]